MSLTAPLDRSVTTAIAEALRQPPVRVRTFETPSGPLWLKRVENLSLRGRLQKGGGRRSFERDWQGLHVLGDAGLPVAPILAEGPDYYVTPDMGVTLRAVVSDQADTALRRAAFQAAGVALAALHANGYSHGRPAIRDLCWDGTSVRFIDMERFSPRRHSPRHIATDMLVFMHSVFATGSGTAKDLDAAIHAYRAAGGPWRENIALARRLRMFGALTAPIWRIVPQSRDLKALQPTLAYVAAFR
jgi:tRNA A-37 threonylcarbamoyl transferase component Bud32